MSLSNFTCCLHFVLPCKLYFLFVISFLFFSHGQENFSSLGLIRAYVLGRRRTPKFLGSMDSHLLMHAPLVRAFGARGSSAMNFHMINSGNSRPLTLACFNQLFSPTTSKWSPRSLQTTSATLPLRSCSYVSLFAPFHYCTTSLYNCAIIFRALLRRVGTPEPSGPYCRSLSRF